MLSPASLRRRARNALGSHRLFVDPGHDLRRTVLIVGSGRSGSTWLGEVVSEATGYRLLFEPFAGGKHPLAASFPYGLHLPAETAAPDKEAAARRILSGRIRSQWTDRYNRARMARGRVVKEIRITNLLPWIGTTFPEVAVVYLARHPVAVARSMSEIGWTEMIEKLLRAPGLADSLPLASAEIRALATEPFSQQVVRWCIDNHRPLTAPLPGRSMRIFYEDTVDDPVRQLTRLGSLLGDDFDASRGLRQVGTPSPTSWRPDSPIARGGTLVSQPDPELARSASRVLDAFGLSHIYGAGPRPLVDVDELP